MKVYKFRFTFIKHDRGVTVPVRSEVREMEVGTRFEEARYLALASLKAHESDVRVEFMGCSVPSFSKP